MKNNQVSFKTKVVNYIKEALCTAAPSMIILNGGYYRPVSLDQPKEEKQKEAKIIKIA